MNLGLLILSYYLLFPVLSREQLWLQDSLDYKSPFEKTNASLYDLSSVRAFLGIAEKGVPSNTVPLSEDFFDEYEDEGIPFPEDLLNPEFGPQSEASELVTGERADGKTPAAEFQYRNASERLALFVYGVEQFSMSPYKNGKNQHVSVNDKRIVRTLYDKKFRVAEKQVFTNSKNAKEIALVKKTCSEYSGSEENGVENKLVRLTEYMPLEKKRRETSFSNEGNPVQVLSYVLKEEGESYVEKKTSRGFDNERRLVWEEEIRYDESGELTRRKNEFSYTDVSPVPNLRFYEDGTLRLTDTYMSEDVHEETLFFDDDYRVQVRYEHGRKTQEIITVLGTEVSRKDFD